jgi:hypothetical protein
MAPLRLDYELTKDDVAAGVEVLVRPNEKAVAVRPALLRLVWTLMFAALALMIYLEWAFWSRLAHIGAPLQAVPLWCLLFLFGLPPLWAVLFAVSWSVTRDPNGALRWVRSRLARQLLSKRAPGPRTLTVSPTGLEMVSGDERLFREWGAMRRAVRGDGHLLLDARDLWFIVPLHALKVADRDALLVEVQARLPIAAT